VRSTTLGAFECTHGPCSTHGPRSNPWSHATPHGRTQHQAGPSSYLRSNASALRLNPRPVSKTKIPWNLLFIDMVLYRNVCPLGHKTQRLDLFLSALHSFHRGFWSSIPEIIWHQIQKFCEGVHHRGEEHTKT
jgi:hypothetical protein